MTQVNPWGNAALRARFEPWLPIAVGVIGVAAFYQLPTPLNVAQQSLLHLLTTNKLVIYVLILVLLAPSLWRGRLPLLDVTGLWILVVALLLMGVSTLVAENRPRSLGYLETNLAFILLYACACVHLRSVKRVENVLRTLIYVGAALVVLTRLHILTLERLLPHTAAAQKLIGDITAAQAASTGIVGGGSRGDLLWFDASITGYIAAGMSVVCVYLLLSRHRSWPDFIFHWALLLLFLFTLIGTLSRGASLGFLAACLPLAVSVVISTERRRFLAGLGFGVVAGIAAEGVLIHNLSILGERLLNAAHTLGFNSGTTTGLEYDRQDTLRLAWIEFLQRPILGWGGRPMGQGNHATSNYLFYLDWLGNWGIVGFTVFLVFVGHVLRSTAALVRRAWPMRGVELHLALALLALLALMLVKGLFAPLEYDFWLYVGLAMGLARSAVPATERAPDHLVPR